MIGTFKNALKSAVANAYQTVYTAPSGKTSVIIRFDISNPSGAGVQASARIRDSSAAVNVYVIKNAPVSEGSTLALVDDQKLVLEANDYIEVICDTASATVDVVCSILEDVNG